MMVLHSFGSPSCWSTALLTLGVFFSCFQVSAQTSNTLAQSTERNERQVHQNQSEMAQKFLTSSLQKPMSESRCIFTQCRGCLTSKSRKHT